MSYIHTTPRPSASSGAQASALTSSRGVTSYSQILKASAWVGGSSVISIAIGIIRTKVMAMLLGPAGFGLAGLYLSIGSLTQSIVGLGINSSGVRQIADAAGSDDSAKIVRTAAVLQHVSLALGILGTLLLIVFSVPISRATFGTDERALGVSLFSLSVFFNLVSAGRGALIQGMRQISALAKMTVIGALAGTIVAIPLVFFLREDGVVPSLVAVAAMTMLTSRWYSRRIATVRPLVNARDFWCETSALLKLGFAFMASNLLMMGSAYVVRIIVRHDGGIEATGMYQAAWAIGGMYVGMILQSMGADFYPRLTAVVSNHSECNRLVNEQAQISMLLAGPGVLGTVTFAPLVISLFYSAAFEPAVALLRWICLGIALRVISWPMGFIIMAKGQQSLILLSEVSWTIVHLGLASVFVGTFGLDGAGMAFFVSYAFHIGITYPMVRRLTGFRWSSDNQRTVMLYLSLTAAVFLGVQVLPGIWAAALGTLATIVSIIYSTRVILALTGTCRLPRQLQKLASTTRLGRGWLSAA